jgi:hypothetical protein
MAHYSVALGGDKRNFPGWDNLYASGNTKGDIRYTPHHAVRQFVLPMDFDGARYDWQSYFKMELATGKPEEGDTFDWYWLNEGTEVKRFVIHNKVAAEGVEVEFQMYDNAGAPVGAAIAADLSEVAFINLGEAVDTAMPTNGTVQMKVVAGDLRTACFSTFIELTDFRSAKACSCAPIICDVELPDPGCFNPIPQI